MMTAGVPFDAGSLVCDAAYALRDFICSASATSPRDAGARARFWRENVDSLDRDNALLLPRLMSEDVNDLLLNNFTSGQLFGGAQAFPELDDNMPETWWDRRAKMLADLDSQVQ